MKTMEELFHAQLQDVYFAEKQLLKALPKLGQEEHQQATRRSLHQSSQGDRGVRSSGWKRCSS